MFDVIWLALMLVGILFCGINGRLEQVGGALLGGAGKAVELSIGLCGGYALWMGLMKIAERAGLMERIAGALGRWLAPLFPGVPRKSTAMNRICLNLSANILGLGNAATPFGLSAMGELQALNPDRQRASDAMCMFLVINSCSIQILPTTIMTLRAAAGSGSPEAIIGVVLLATACSTAAGIGSALLLRKVWR